MTEGAIRIEGHDLSLAEEQKLDGWNYIRVLNFQVLGKSTDSPAWTAHFEDRGDWETSSDRLRPFV